MGRKGPRQIVFVCSAIHNEKLISKLINSETGEEACKSFESEFFIKPETVYGPFFKKKTGVLDNEISIKFSNEEKKAMYDGWYVTAIILSSPEGFAYLFYDKRKDNKKMQKPTSNIVKIEELKEVL